MSEMTAAKFEDEDLSDEALDGAVEARFCGHSCRVCFMCGN